MKIVSMLLGLILSASAIADNHNITIVHSDGSSSTIYIPKDTLQSGSNTFGGGR